MPSIADVIDLRGSLSEVRERAADAAEAEMVARAIGAADGNLEQAASTLGLSANALRKRMKRRADSEDETP
jgi:DNA-binding NtrC family response regulator